MLERLKQRFNKFVKDHIVDDDRLDLKYPRVFEHMATQGYKLAAVIEVVAALEYEKRNYKVDLMKLTPDERCELVTALISEPPPQKTLEI